MKPVIFLWSHPRSMSTAIERIMRERGDLHCLHEPFLHYYYLQRTGKTLAHFEVEANHPVSFEDTRDSILQLAEETPVFAKDMSYYVMPDILRDIEFCARVQHCFLIRNPLRSILSYYRLDSEFSLEEVGIEAQWLHFQGLVESGQSEPLVLEAEAIQDDPRAVIGSFWQKLGLDYREQAFDWNQTSTPSDWQYVKGWHQQVSKSRGIEPDDQNNESKIREEFEQAVQKAPHLQQYLDYHLPSYQALRAHSLKTVSC